MIAFLLLVKMDVEREIEYIELEASVAHNFDDLSVCCNSQSMYCQMKDYKDIKAADLKREKNELLIKGIRHKLSDKVNIVFIKDINIVPDTEILGFQAMNLDGIFIVSISREEAWNIINSLYEFNEYRIIKIEGFFNKSLDDRRLFIKRSDLPLIDLYSTELIDKTIKLQEITLGHSNIVQIEGKPGVGKSHLVNQLELENEKILYRFWVSNQDKNYRERLSYNNFTSNIAKELFNNYIHKTEEEISIKLHEDSIILIVDGLDHVENYNSSDLQLFIDFINRVGEKSKVVVLTRPLKAKTNWETIILNNWNFNQTMKLLDEYYHITDYEAFMSIYQITDGYPILVSFLAKHYKKFYTLPDIGEVKNISDYYDNVVRDVNVKSALTLFLTSRSYFMRSEINNLLENELVDLVNDFIDSYPYLFEIRINRVSLLHDSFNTYLREQEICNYEKRKSIVHNKVFDSIMNGEKRYLSRFDYFDLPLDMKIKVVQKYSNIREFKILMEECVDFEAIQAFYYQVRRTIGVLKYDNLSIIQYYDLSLIYNIIHRDHISSLNRFLYTYVTCLLFNGYSEEDIISSDYIFAFLYFLHTNDMELIKKVMGDDNFSTDDFYDTLASDISEEETYFELHDTPISLLNEIYEVLISNTEYIVKDLIKDILVNVYIHGTSELTFEEMHRAIILFIDSNDLDSSKLLIEKELAKYNVRTFFAHSILQTAKDELESLGYIKKNNDYKNLTLNDYIMKYACRGSFDVLKRVQAYLRLSMKENRKIDINSISKFWTMYYERKDYSVINIHEALKVFEIKGMISEIESCGLINSVQKLSEKGIRYLFDDYIEIHDVGILELLDNNFVLDELNIHWFELPVNYINYFSDSQIKAAIRQQLHYNSITKKIRVLDIENALLSKKISEILEVFSLLKFVIEISKDHYLLEELKKRGAYLQVVPSEKIDNSYKSNSDERYSQGIITFEDIDYIKELKLKNYEVAAFTDGYYSLLADLDVFSIYLRDDMKQNIGRILYNAFLGKIKSRSLYGNLYYFVGNLPKMFHIYDTDVDWESIYSSFRLFLDLSLIKE